MKKNMQENQIQRVMVFGLPGSGKSTFCHQLACQKGMPLLHVDKIYFEERWQKRDRNEFLKDLESWVEKETWIIDGNSVQSLEMRYKRADICLYFKAPRLVCLWRVLKRVFKRDWPIEDRAPGCKERFSFRLISYMWRLDGRIQPLLRDFQKKYPHTKLKIVTSKKQTQAVFSFLKKHLPSKI